VDNLLAALKDVVLIPSSRVKQSAWMVWPLKMDQSVVLRHQ